MNPLPPGVRRCITGIVLMLALCTSNVITFEKQLLLQADNSVRASNFDDAIRIYRKICGNYPKTSSAPLAQYRLALAYIHHRNRDADTRRALRAFREFVRRYPDSELRHGANTWIRMLVVLHSYEKTYRYTKQQLNIITKMESDPSQKPVPDRNVLKHLHRCRMVTDSLEEKIDELREAIRQLGTPTTTY